MNKLTTKLLLTLFLLSSFLIGTSFKNNSSIALNRTSFFQQQILILKQFIWKKKPAKDIGSTIQQRIIKPSSVDDAAPSFSQSTQELIPLGAYIINMGITPQTEGNALKPYGLIWELLHNQYIPIKWAINSGKAKDGIDFTYNGMDFKGGPFIILAEFRNPAVDAIISNWEAQGVIGLTTTADFMAPIDRTIQYSMNWTLDNENGSIAENYLENAGVPETAYNWVLPENLNCCNDVFLMPHAHPDWESHNNLLYWNDSPGNGGCSGAIWAGCKAVSELENIFNPANPNEKLNFLMLDANAPTTNPAVWSNDHDDGTLPYSYNHHDHPIMQFIGVLDGAQEGGAEQIYMPTNAWRPSTQIGIWQPVHEDIPTLSPGPAAKLAFGYAFGDNSRGYVGYEASHSFDGDDPENIAAQRAFLNFSFRAVEDKAIKPLVIVPPTMSNGVTYNLNSAASGGSGNYNFEWTSDCPGAFANPFSSNTTFTPGIVYTPTECIIQVNITDDCGSRFGFEKITITIVPSPLPPVAVDDNETTHPGVPVIIDALANDYDPNLDPITLTLIGSGTTADGIFVDNGDGTVTYTSDLDFIGTDQIDYEICDTTGLCDTATITVVVDITDANGCFPSEYYGVYLEGNADMVVDENSISNPISAIGDPVLVVDDNNYYAKLDSDSDYLILDLTDTLPIGAVINIYFGTDDGSPATLQVQGTLNGIDYENGNDFYDLQSYNSIKELDNDFPEQDIVTYSPVTNSTRYLRFTRATDSGKPSINGVVYELYDCINAIPTALKDATTILENKSANYQVQTNDNDPQGLLLTTAIIQQGDNGTAVVNADGSITYSPNDNYSGLDSVIYQVCNPNNLCAEATFCIQVNDDGCAPGAIVEIEEDLFWGEALESSNSVDNEDDAIGLPDGNYAGDIKDITDQLDIELSGVVMAGDTVKVYHTNTGWADIYVSNDNVSYTLVQNDVPLTTNPHKFIATSTFSFIRFMGTTGDSNEQYEVDAIEIPVRRINCLTAFINALDDQKTTTEFTAVDISVTANDLSLPNLNPSTVTNTGVKLPSNGIIENIDAATGVITYLPNPSFSGIDSFEYIVCNLSNLCDTALIIINVYCNIGGTESGTFVGKRIVAAIGVDDTYKALGYADDEFSDEIKEASEKIDIELTGTVLIGDNVHIYSKDDGVANIYTSLDNSSYKLSVGNADISANPYIFAANTDFNFIRIKAYDEEKFKLDAIEIPYFHQSDPVVKGYVYYDDNDNQLLDATTEGLQENVKLYAYKDVDVNGVISTGDVLVDSTLTEATGRYTFSLEAPSGTGAGTITSQISQGSDDAEESPNVVSTPANLAYHTSSDLEMADDGSYNGDNQLVGLRFPNIAIPQGAIINSAKLSFVGNGSSSSTTNLAIYGEAVDDALTFSNASYNISNRLKTSNSTSWNNIVSWSDNDVYDSPDISSIVQELVNRAGWISNNDMAFILSGNGNRRAYAFDGNSTKAPVLTINYSLASTITYVILMDTTTLPPNKAVSTGITEQVIFTGAGQGFCAVNFGIYNHLPPVALNDTFYTEVGVNLPIFPLVNDYDPENTPLSLDILTQPVNGMATDNGDNKTFAYTRNDVGTETFEYYICDSGTPSLCDTANITVIISSFVNNPPAAMDDYDTLVVNTNIVTDVLENDFDPEYGEMFTYLNAGILQPSNGAVSIYVDNKIQYTPNYTFTGNDTYEYIVCDDVFPALCDTATVYIHVTNQPPDAKNDIIKIGIDVPTPINILVNDEEPDGHDILLISAGTDASDGQTNQGGTVHLNNNGTSLDPSDDFVDYIPSAGYTGMDTFYYHIDDSGTPTLSDIARVIITITPIVDLELEKKIAPAITAVGQNVTFTITLTNTGDNTATRIRVRDKLPTDYNYAGDNGLGAYDAFSGVWYIPSLASGSTISLDIYATIIGTEDLKNVAEVIATDQADIDSEPANSGACPTEDDGDFARPTFMSTLGDEIWLDLNGDSIRNPLEAGIGNMMICISNESITKINDTIYTTGAYIDTVFTDSLGLFSFENLPDGDWQIKVLNDPSEYTPTYDADGGVLNVCTFTLTGGIVQVANNPWCSSPNCADDLDFGLRFSGDYSLAGNICVDDDLDGICNSVGDSQLEAVDVLLYSGAGKYLGGLPTAVTGGYLFPFLGPNDYIVSLSTNQTGLDTLHLSTALGDTPASAISVTSKGILQLVEVIEDVVEVDYGFTNCIIEATITNYPTDTNHYLCTEETYMFEAAHTSAGANYAWDFGATATPATAMGIGPHAVQFTAPTDTDAFFPEVVLAVDGGNNCVFTDTVALTIHPLPTITNVNTTNPSSCNGADGIIAINLMAENNLCFEISLDGGNNWQANNETTFNGLNAGSYNLMLRYCNGDCPNTYGIVTLSDPATVIAVDDIFPNLCPGTDMEGSVAQNDTNLMNTIFSLVEAPVNGVVTFEPTGVFKYASDEFVCGNEQFSYQVCNVNTSCCAVASVTLLFGDTTKPTLINVPVNDTIHCDEEIPLARLVTAIDNCPSIGINVSETSTQGEDGCSLYDYTLTRTWIATDLCGNTTSGQQILDVQDLIAPDIFKIQTLPNGKKLVAGVMESVGTRWKTVNLPIDFITEPIILAQVSTNNDNTPVTVQIRNTSTAQFEVRLIQEEANNNNKHLRENISWIAVEPGVQIDNYHWEAKAGIFTDAYQTINFQHGFDVPPAFFATPQTTNEEDAVSVKQKNNTLNSIDIHLVEETSEDAEVTHSNEQIGYLAVEASDELKDEKGRIFGETKTVNLSNNWTTFNLVQNYFNPVIIMNTPSENELDANVVRVRNVTANSFEASITEWENEDGNHIGETVSYIVVEGSIPIDIPNFCDAETDSLEIGIDIKAIDNCDFSVIVNYSEVATFVGAEKITQRVWSATDECGNTTQYTQSLTCEGVSLQLKSFLQGALINNNGDGLMRDDLRRKGLIPLEEPYSKKAKFLHINGGGGEKVDSSLLTITGNDGIVDWVFVELRAANNIDSIVATLSGMIQRDGDVISGTGDTLLNFLNTPIGDYFVSIRHRNHIGMVTMDPIPFTPNTIPFVDFTFSFTPVQGANPKIETDGQQAMWSGDLNGDGRIIYQGPNNDAFSMFLHILLDDNNKGYLTNYISRGYTENDFNLDGTVIYQGPNNDKALLLFNTILNHPDNDHNFANFIIQVNVNP